MIRLYELQKGSIIVIDNEELVFDHVDGAYSYCINKDGKVVHLSAYTPLIKIDNFYEIDDTCISWQ